MAVRPWTLWKYKVMKYCSALNTDQQKKTDMQVHVKTRLVRQREFGIIAGRWRRSWRFTQRRKVGNRAMERERRVRFRGSMRRAVLDVTVLWGGMEVSGCAGQGTVRTMKGERTHAKT
jgi:hypothetical protein